MTITARSVVPLLCALALGAGCAAFDHFVGVAAPAAASAIATYQARARELAPTADDTRLDAIATRLAAVEAADARASAATSCASDAAKVSTDQVLVAALEAQTKATADATRERDALQRELAQARAPAHNLIAPAIPADRSMSTIGVQDAGSAEGGR
jgi:hypothetical protein